MTFKLTIDEPDIWFVQSILDSADNLCLIDKTTMVGNKGIMMVHVEDGMKEDFLYLVSKVWESSRLAFEQA